MGDCPARDLCDVLVSFFNVIHFKLLKNGRVVGRPACDTRRHFLTDSYKPNLWGSLKSVITEAFLPCF